MPQLPHSPTVAHALDYCEAVLGDAGLWFGHGTDNAWDEAAQLVLHCASLPASADESVLSERMSDEQVSLLIQLLERRIHDKVPLPYLTGKAWFAGLEFSCDQRALVPRSPIAELISTGFQPWYGRGEPSTALDLCCGGGSIGLAMACHLPQLRVDLADLSLEALALAEVNRQRLDLQSRTRVVQSDLFDALHGRKYDLIVSNPPYVDARDLEQMPAEYHHEPPMGLGSGADGLNITRRLLREAGAFLNSGGLLVVEVGNSWEALESAFPELPFTWIEFEQGGHGVFALTRQELSLRRS